MDSCFSAGKENIILRWQNDPILSVLLSLKIHTELSAGHELHCKCKDYTYAENRLVYLYIYKYFIIPYNKIVLFLLIQNTFQREYIISKYDHPYLTDWKNNRNSINNLPNSWFPTLKALLEIIITISQLLLLIFKSCSFCCSE